MSTKMIFLIPEKVTCTDESGIQHEPGDAFNDNRCESRCTCTENGDIVCQPLNCPTGLIRRGKKREIDEDKKAAKKLMNRDHFIKSLMLLHSV